MGECLMLSVARHVVVPSQIQSTSSRPQEYLVQICGVTNVIQAIVLPLELVVAGLTVNYWGVEVSIAVWIAVFMIAIIIINIFGVLGYAEEEFWVSCLKLITIIVFMIMGVIFVCGGGPANGLYVIT